MFAIQMHDYWQQILNYMKNIEDELQRVTVSLFLRKFLNTHYAKYSKIFSNGYLQCSIHGVFSVFKKIMCI